MQPQLPGNTINMYSMDEKQTRYEKWKKPNTTDYIPYDCIYISI